MGLVEAAARLSSREALVSVYLGERESYVWTIGTGGRTAFRVVPLSRREVESDVAKLRGALELTDTDLARLRTFDLGTAHRLYRAFFQADESIWSGAQVLNVILHGALGQLPVGLLVTEEATADAATGKETQIREVPWLIRKVAIAQLPSVIERCISNVLFKA